MTDRRWRPPAPETLTINPHDQHWLTRQLPQATLYGEPIPDNTPIIEDTAIPPGTVRIHINGKDVHVQFAPSTGRSLQWTLPEPYPTWTDTIKPETT
jgi:hypothetical protein